MSEDADALLARLWRHPETLEPGLRLFDPLPESVRALGAIAGGPDPLGRPVLLLTAPADAADPATSVLELAARAHADAGALAPWFSRPREPRIFLLCSGLATGARARLALLAPALGLRVWSGVSGAAEGERPRWVTLLPERLKRPLAEAPPAPAGSQQHLRRLLHCAGQIQPELQVHGAAWPLVFTGPRGACAAVHRDGDDLLFVTERAARRTEVLRLADEESVDRALDALMREQFAPAW